MRTRTDTCRTPDDEKHAPQEEQCNKGSNRETSAQSFEHRRYSSRPALSAHKRRACFSNGITFHATGSLVTHVCLVMMCRRCVKGMGWPRRVAWRARDETDGAKYPTGLAAETIRWLVQGRLLIKTETSANGLIGMPQHLCPSAQKRRACLQAALYFTQPDH